MPATLTFRLDEDELRQVGFVMDYLTQHSSPYQIATRSEAIRYSIALTVEVLKRELENEQAEPEETESTTNATGEGIIR